MKVPYNFFGHNHGSLLSALAKYVGSLCFPLQVNLLVCFLRDKPHLSHLLIPQGVNPEWSPYCMEIDPPPSESSSPLGALGDTPR